MTPRLIARELWPNVSSFIEELALALNLPHCANRRTKSLHFGAQNPDVA